MQYLFHYAKESTFAKQPLEGEMKKPSDIDRRSILRAESTFVEPAIIEVGDPEGAKYVDFKSRAKKTGEIPQRTRYSDSRCNSVCRVARGLDDYLRSSQGSGLSQAVPPSNV